ncbi:MAG: penicillin acylase family protein, partial [Flavobacteriaceae bacterium]|nr:penicillin acylase family protein [Flavobacteriaceae bacterium]
MRLIFLVLTAIILSFSSCATKQGEFIEDQRLEEIASRVTIVRDSFGVPHIYGESDADAIFGMLYAQCEDDFNRVEQNYIWATGRLAEVEGESAIYSDLRANMFMTQDEAEQMYENSPEEVKQWCQAFADGVNYYLMTHPEVKPRLLTKFEPWMPLYFSEGSIGGDIERVSTRKIKAFYEEDTDQDLAFASLDDQLVQFEEPQGSNGIALDGSMTESGNAMLLINPHTSFYFRGELQMKSNENLNAYGAVTWGQFFIYQGFNEHTGWMHTSTYTDVIDEFQEEIITKNDELYYKYGEELRAVTSLEVPLNYKTDEGVQEKIFTVYRTHHGPITHKDGDKWVATAMMWDPVNALKQSFERTIQSDYKGFRQMMDIKTNSSNNTVYADSDGNIAYFHGNFIPKRDVNFDYAKPVDGSDPATDWNGLHDVEDHIKLLNPSVGWLQNCNSTPFTSADIDSPKAEDYPYYMSTTPENFRGIHAIDLLKNTEKLSLDGLIDLAYDNRLPAFEVLIPGLIKAFDANPNRAYAKEINHLRNWDYRTTEKSIAMTLA